MKRNSYSSLAFAVVVALGLVASSLAIAQSCNTCPGYTPSPNSAVISMGVFNDCPGTARTSTNNYPGHIQISDAYDCPGGANLHVWSFSEDGITPAVFENCSHYQYSTVFTGTSVGGVSEGGLRLSPWWSLDVDGRFMVRIGGNGEIACFGGRLPFYSFTGAYGVTYVPGTPIWMQITYSPRALTLADPATIVYKIFYQGQTYFSPYLPFDSGNVLEGHGEFGELCPARVGGYCQVPGAGGPVVTMTANWDNIQYEGPSATPATRSSWGQLKTMYR
jgi:hypothetical protein